MKTGLILIKDVFQPQIRSKLVDLCIAWTLSLSLVERYSQQSVSIRRLAYGQLPEAVDFYLGVLKFRSEFSFLKIKLIEMKEMAKNGTLSEDAFQSLLDLVPLIDNHFSEWILDRSWTTDAISKFKLSVREIFSSEFCPLIEEKFHLPVLDVKIIDPSLTIEQCMELLDTKKDNSYRHPIESYMVSKFPISELIKAKKSNLDHPVFSSRFFLTSCLGPH
jgi:hypothetical protein